MITGDNKDEPKKLITISDTAHIALLETESGEVLDAPNLANVDAPIPNKAPMILRTVNSSC